MGLGELLRRPDFRLLLAGQSLSMFGDSAMLLVLAIWVKELTGSNGAAGMTLVFVALPSLLGPLGGWLIDRVRRRPFLVVTNLCSAVAVLPLLAVHGRDRLWLIYSVAAVYGALLVLHVGAMNALLKTMLPEEVLGEANGVLQTTKEGLRLVAPLSGAALYTVIGGGGVAVLDGVTFVAAATALGVLGRFGVHEPRVVKPETAMRSELAAGIRFLWEARPLLHVTIALAMALLVIGIAESVVFAIVELLGKPPEFVGVVVAVQGIGAVAGGVVAARLIAWVGEVRTVIVGLIAFGAGAGILVVTWLPAITVGVVLAGFGLPLVLVGFVTVLQRSAAGPLVGRVTTAAHLVIGVPQTVSVALGACLVPIVDHRILVGTMASGTLLAACYLAATSGRRRTDATPRGSTIEATQLASGAVPSAMAASRAMGWTVPDSRTQETPPQTPERPATRAGRSTA